MRRSIPVAVPLLLSLLAIPGAMAKEASASPPAETPTKTQKVPAIAPKSEHQQFFQQVKENPTKFGDHDAAQAEHKKSSSSTKVHAKPVSHAAAHHSTTTPVVPPTTAAKTHVLQDLKQNPLKYNDARPEHKAIPGQKERPQDQY